MNLPDFIQADYQKCLTALEDSGIASILTESGKPGFIGDEGTQYPIPSLYEVEDIFQKNSELVKTKVSQGFWRFELIPFAASISFLIERMKELIIKKSSEVNIYRASTSECLRQTAIKVNNEKQVWPWERLLDADKNNEIVYFPKQYKPNHEGFSKQQVINNGSICALPGWSVGLVENIDIMPGQGVGKTIGGRKQLEVGNSPNEYRQILAQPEYFGETGKTLEDFIIEFILRLSTKNEVSNDEDDFNGLWCLGQYVRLPYADVVPAGRWVGRVGRVRLDMHRSNNKKCTSVLGASTVVRLPRKQI